MCACVCVCVCVCVCGEERTEHRLAKRQRRMKKNDAHVCFGLPMPCLWQSLHHASGYTPKDPQAVVEVIVGHHGLP